MTPCVECARPLIRGCCPDCTPTAFVAALFELDVQPSQFITPAHYGAWMRLSPLIVDGPRPKVNGKWKAIVLKHFGHRCYHCGSTSLLTFGHLVPWCCGGTDQPGNGVPECGSCNVRQYAPLAAYLKRLVAA